MIAEAEFLREVETQAAERRGAGGDPPHRARTRRPPTEPRHQARTGSPKPQHGGSDRAAAGAGERAAEQKKPKREAKTKQNTRPISNKKKSINACLFKSDK